MAGTKQPSDKSHFILPDLGEGVHEAELIKWRVKPGDRVEEHQTLADMETDKALVEVPSPWGGVIKETLGKEGDIIKVGSKLVTYEVGARAPGLGAREPATSPAPAAAGPAPRQAESKSRAHADEDQGTVVGSVGGTLTIPGRFARRPPDQEGNGAPGTRGKSLATPAVRRIAREAGIDINRVQGSGRGGRVTASDVQNFAGDRRAPSVRDGRPPQPADRPADRPAAGVTVVASGEDQRIAFRGVRRKIAQALHQSVKTAVHFTVVDEADVTALDRKRK
jgi:pyruvate dehydrogenase E2 component (dihydrolipoamide acetyltransferase)